MKTEAEILATVTEKACALGAFRANVIDASEVVTDASFRDICAQNACGQYGKCWACPPDAGKIEDLMQSLAQYKYLLLFQTVGTLEDSFDFEGMQAAKQEHNSLVLRLRESLVAEKQSDFLILGAGGCGVCAVCAKRTGEPCRHPELAFRSLEAYGIFVSKTAEKAGMNYINGKDTVTYFGGVFFNLPSNATTSEEKL